MVKIASAKMDCHSSLATVVDKTFNDLNSYRTLNKSITNGMLAFLNLIKYKMALF